MGENMDRIVVRAAKVAETLRAVVAERPEYVYSRPEHMTDEISCFYVHTDPNGGQDEPGCLIGAVLHKLGVPLDELRKHEGDDAYQVFPALVAVTEGDPQAVRGGLLEAQIQQDSGFTWAEALSDAEPFLAGAMLRDAI